MVRGPPARRFRAVDQDAVAPAALARRRFVQTQTTQDVIAARLTENDQTTRIESTGTVGDFRSRIIIVVRSRQGQPQILTREEVPLF